jgi:hypothetical protein
VNSIAYVPSTQNRRSTNFSCYSALNEMRISLHDIKEKQEIASCCLQGRFHDSPKETKENQEQSRTARNSNIN